jgi:hypothetical protein
MRAVNRFPFFLEHHDCMKGTPLLWAYGDRVDDDAIIQTELLHRFQIGSSTSPSPVQQMIFCMPIFRRLMVSFVSSFRCLLVLKLATQTEHHRDCTEVCWNGNQLDRQ